MTEGEVVEAEERGEEVTERGEGDRRGGQDGGVEGGEEVTSVRERFAVVEVGLSGEGGDRRVETDEEGEVREGVTEGEGGEDEMEGLIALESFVEDGEVRIVERMMKGGVTDEGEGKSEGGEDAQSMSTAGGELIAHDERE
jgi:hypothetical protein